MKEAELEDGTILEFPDGTEDSVIDSAVKKHLGKSDLPVAAQIPLEFMAGFNRSALKLADFLGPDQVNAILELAGSDKRVPTLMGSSLGKGAAAGFMEPGLAKDIIGTAGEVASAAVPVGAALRYGAESLPTIQKGSESIMQGALREFGKTSAAQDIIAGAGAGAGMAAGGHLGGAPGELIGGIIGGMTPAGIKASASKMFSESSPSIAKNIAVETAEEASQQTGIPLFKAQKTLDPELIEKQAFVSQVPAGAQKARTALLKQNEAATEAVDELLKSIAPDSSIIQAQGKFQSASERAIEAAKLARKEKTSQLFEDAFNKGAEVDLTPVRGLAAKTLKDFPESGEISRTLKKALKLMAEKPAEKIPSGKIVGTSGEPIIPEQIIENPLTLRQLANAKIEIDQMLSRNFDGSLGHQTRANLVALKSKLLEQMDAASPEYKTARGKFAELSPPINELEESIIGKIANLDPTQLKTISQKIFDPQQTNPAVVKRAKQVIDSVDPDAWNMLIRAEVERRMGAIKPEVGASTENTPGQLLRAIFGNTKQQAALMAGLNDAQKANFTLLRTALERAQLGRPGGSQTAIREEIKKELRGGFWLGLRDFIRAPIKEGSSLAENKQFNRRVSVLAEALFDPRWTTEMNKALKDKSGKSLGFLLYSINDAMPIDTEQETPEQNRQQQ